MALSRALEVIQSVGRLNNADDQIELYNRGQTFNINRNSYKVENLIAKGGFGSVFLATDSKGNKVAVKIMLSHDSATKKDIDNETNMLRTLSHENIITLYDASEEFRGGNKSVQEIRICMEYCKYSIADILAKIKSADLSFIIRIVLYTSRAVSYMHSKEIIHRDIKAENLLINLKNQLKLCDFGSATNKSVDMSNMSNSERLAIQEEMFRYTTPITRSPEVCDAYSNWPIGKQQDVWAMGCLMYFICFGEHPFDGSALAIINGKYKKSPSAQEHQLGVFSPIIDKCLVPNPSERCSLDFIIQCMDKLAQKVALPLDFADVSAKMSMYIKDESPTTDNGQGMTLVDVQDKIMNNLMSFKNTMLQSTTKFGNWPFDLKESAQSSTSTPKMAERPRVASTKPMGMVTRQDKPAAPPRPPPVEKPSQSKTENPDKLLIEADWPSNRADDEWGDFSQAKSATKEVFDPFGIYTASSNTNSVQHDLLDVGDRKGMEKMKSEPSLQSMNDNWDPFGINSSSTTSLQPQKIENSTIKKVEKVDTKMTSQSSSQSLDEMVNQMLKVSNKK